MSKDSKIRIHKTAVRLILMYAGAIRADITKMTETMKTVEMKVLRTIQEKTQTNRGRNQDLRQQSNMEDLKKWVRERREYQNKHIGRTKETRIARKAKYNKTNNKRLTERQPKRWKEGILHIRRDVIGKQNRRLPKYVCSSHARKKKEKKCSDQILVPQLLTLTLIHFDKSK